MTAKALPLCLCLCFSLATAAFAKSGAVIREPGVIYLEDLVPRPIRITVKNDAPIYYASDLGRWLGTLKKGQLVELQAVSDTAYRVRGMAQQGQVAGWVSPDFLATLKPEFLANLKQNAARHEEVAALIAKNEVAVNMTPEEVTASLGKPSRVSARQDANGRQDVWEFIRYERVPQEVTGYDRYGRLVTTVQYVKVPAGKISVVFENNLVSSLEKSEGSLERDARIRTVLAPLVIAY